MGFPSGFSNLYHDHRSYRTKIILVIHVLEFRKIFCMRKLQGISGKVRGIKSAVSVVKKIFVSSLRGYLVVLLHVALNSVV